MSSFVNSLTFAGIAAAFSLYGLTSLVLHNRRQKRAWIEREMQRLEDARIAFLKSEATAEQLHLLEQERAGEEMAVQAAEAKRRKRDTGLWRRFMGATGLNKGDLGREEVVVGVGELRLAEGGHERLLEEGGTEFENQGEIADTGSAGVMQTIGNREGERNVIAHTGVKGGPLDVMAGNMAGALSPQGDRSWLSWLRGEGKP